MAGRASEIDIAFLEGFLDAWNRHDLDAILAFLTPDCTYITGAGDLLDGHPAIRTGLAAFLDAYPDAHWSDATHFAAGDRGASEWIFTATSDGRRMRLDSCDLFTFRDGRIARVSAYRRARDGR